MFRAALPLALALITSSALAQTYDPAADFTPGSNSGTWTYGNLSTSGTFALNTLTWNKPGTDARGWTGEDYQVGDGYRNPFVMKNTGATAASIVSHYGQGWGFTLEPGALAMGGPGYLQSIVRFTAPAAGQYSVDGSFTKLMNKFATDAADGINVAVRQGGSTLHSDLLTGAVGDTSAFSLGTISMTAGETLDFAVFDGPQGSFQATGLQARIVANPVPEPATIAAIGLGVAGLLRRRKQKPGGSPQA